jgi:hypothetical protein
LFKDRDEARLGVVVHNARGLPIASLVQKIIYPQSVEVVKALAAKHVIQFSLEIGISEGEFEGDSEFIVLALKEGSHHHALYGHILEEVRALSVNLSQAQFQHIKRQGNIVAHALARHA